VAPRQCPKCDLRFVTADELDDHLARDHAVDPERLPDRRPAPPPLPPATPGR